MWKYIGKDKKATSLKLVNGKIIRLSENSLYVNESKVLMDEDIYGVTFIGEDIIYSSGDKTKFKGEIFEKTLVSHVFDEIALFSSNLNLTAFTLSYEFIDLNNGNSIKCLGHLPFLKSTYSTSERFFLNMGNRIKCFSNNNGINELWIWDLNIDGCSEIDRIFGVYDNQLIISGKKHNIISIDIETGLFLFRIQNIDGLFLNEEYKNLIPRSSDFVLDNEKLISLYYKYFLEINLASKKTECFDLTNEFSKYRLIGFGNFYDNPITSEYIYATGIVEDPKDPELQFDALLVLSRKEKSILWHFIFKENGIGNNIPLLFENQIMILDTEKNIHLFQKE